MGQARVRSLVVVHHPVVGMLEHLQVQEPALALILFLVGELAGVVEYGKGGGIGHRANIARVGGKKKEIPPPNGWWNFTGL
jgi:hypothetical protein